MAPSLPGTHRYLSCFHFPASVLTLGTGRELHYANGDSLGTSTSFRSVCACAWRIGSHSKYQIDFQSRSCRMSLIAFFRFPVNKIEFPDTCFYFPVLGFREIACNSLKTRGNNRPNCVFEAKMTKIPCFFAVKQGNPIETGWLKTASTASLSY